MLKYLHIKNIVLIEEALINFSEGLHILTGETGAGKTSFISAFHLCLGAKADSSLIRRGEKSAFVEAVFEIKNQTKLLQLLFEGGIVIDEGEDLIIKRTLDTTKKSGAFINNQTVPVSFLGQIASYLVENVGMGEQTSLYLSDKQREYLDLFMQNESLIGSMHTAFLDLKKTEKAYDDIREALKDKDQERLFLEAEKKLIEEVNVTEGEEEALFLEYKELKACLESESLQESLYANIEEFLVKHRTLLPSLQRLVKLSPPLEKLLQHHKNAEVELSEIDYLLRSSLGKAASSPARMAEIEKRLDDINALYKRFGGSYQRVHDNITRIQNRLNFLSSAEKTEIELESTLNEKKHKAMLLAQKLTHSRKKAAISFTEALMIHLKELNMPHVSIDIQFTETPLSLHGKDEISILFSANLGSPLLPVCKVASGGELSRLLFTIKIILADREQIPLMIFDEIDANIGGTTATLVGEKLRKMAEFRQVFAITHFSQVAKQANHHFEVKKTETNDSVFCQIRLIEGKDREEELLRMTGGALQFSYL